MDTNNGHPLGLHALDQSRYGEPYRQHVFDQYKIMVESIEKNSDRRQNANNYFVTIQVALFTLVGLTFSLGSVITKLGARIVVSIAGIAVCVIFYYLLRSYKQIATGKFSVIHEIENQLPMRIYAYEWFKLKEGKDKKTYFPFSHVEMNLPWIFGFGYLAFAVMSIVFFFSSH